MTAGLGRDIEKRGKGLLRQRIVIVPKARKRVRHIENADIDSLSVTQALRLGGL